MGRNGKKDWKECNWRQRKERVSEIYERKIKVCPECPELVC